MGMKRFFGGFFAVLLLAAMVYAVPFTPQGNIQLLYDLNILQALAIETVDLNAVRLEVTGDSNFASVGISKSLFVDENVFASDANIGGIKIPQVFIRMTEPSGFSDRTSSSLGFVDATRVFTITGTNFPVYVNGVEYLKNTETITVDDTNGTHWIYYEADGTLSQTMVTQTFELPTIATIYYNTGFDKGTLGEERHGMKMDVDTHALLHYTVGTRYESGLTGTFGNTTFATTSGVINDEDIAHIIGPETTCKVFYKDGAADFVWTTEQAAYYHEVGGVLQYNNGNVLASAGVSNHVAYWVFATNDTTTPIYSLMGQRKDVTLANARINNTYESLTLGTLPFQEMKILYRVILKNVGGTTTYVETQDLRSVSNLPAGTYVATQHNVLTGLNWAQAGHTFDADLNVETYALKSFGDSNFLNVGVSGTVFGTDANFSELQATNIFANLDWSFIQDAPWITTSGADTNWASEWGIFDANMQSYYQLLTSALPDTTIDTNQTAFDSVQADLNLFYNKLLDSNNVSRLGYTVLADVPWAVGAILADTTIDTNATAYASIQSDLNTLYCLFLDSNNASRLLYAVIADNPYIPTELDIDNNAIAVDTNANTECADANAVLTSAGTCLGVTGFHIKTEGTPTVDTTIDTNQAAFDSVQTDMNLFYNKYLDTNNTSRLGYAVIADAPWAIGTILADTTIDTNTTAYASIQTDLNTFYCIFNDSNNASRLSYSVIADPPWLTSATIPPDTTIDTNQTAFDSIQADLNNFYNKYLDTNNPSRLIYTVIADAPWITNYLDTTLDTNADAQKWFYTNDTNYLKVADFNSQYSSIFDSNNVSRLGYTVIADAPWATGTILADTTCDTNAGGCSNYTLTSDMNDASRLGYAVIADPPWAVGAILPDTTIDTNQTAFDSIQADMNNFYCLFLDQNDASRLTYSVIADAPWITNYVDSTLDTNADAQDWFYENDTNYSKVADFNAQYCSIFDSNNISRVTYAIIADAPWITNYVDTTCDNNAACTSWADGRYAVGTILADTTIDTNQTAFDSIQTDLNNFYCSFLDSNNASRLSYAIIADPPWATGTILPDSTIDTNQVAFDSIQADLNLFYCIYSDQNNVSRLDYTVIANPPWATGAILADTTIDTNTAAQAWFYSVLDAYTPWDDANVADDITLTNITQITSRAFSDISSRNFSLLTLDNNAQFDARYAVGTILADTTIDTNQTAFDSIQTDLNLFYCLASDQNNTSRLSYAVISDPPWISGYVDSTLDTNTTANTSWLGKVQTHTADVNVSSGINTGIGIDADMNRICFPSNSCEFSIDYNGTALVFGG